MEGRMMLSATGFDAPQPGLDTTQFTVLPAQISLAGTWIKLADFSADGGFANADVTNHGIETYVTRSTGVDSYLRFNSFISIDQAVGSNTFHLLNSSLLDSAGLDVAVIAAWGNGAETVTNIQPVVVGPSPTMPGVSEGGAIPIHAIFADFRKDSHLASGVKVVSSPSAETSVAQLASSRQLSTPDNAIAGEWARAMVFEIAGGEPTASDSLGGQRAKTSDSDESLQLAEPPSSVETPKKNAKSAGQHAVGLQSEGTPVGDLGQPPATQANEQIAAIVTQLLSDGKLAAADGIGRSPAGAAVGALNPDATALAAAAVFDQFGEGNAAVIESRVDGKSWLRSIGTSPLLMVLALERIAALNSRRASRESRIAATKKLLRLRS